MGGQKPTLPDSSSAPMSMAMLGPFPASSTYVLFLLSLPPSGFPCALPHILTPSSFSLVPDGPAVRKQSSVAGLGMGCTADFSEGQADGSTPRS